MASKFDKLRKKMLASPAARKEYERLGPEFEVASALISARKRAKLTQEELAKRMKTRQTAIARMESGRHLSSMKTIANYAAATGCRVSLKLVGNARAARATKAVREGKVGAGGRKKLARG